MGGHPPLEEPLVCPRNPFVMGGIISMYLSISRVSYSVYDFSLCPSQNLSKFLPLLDLLTSSGNLIIARCIGPIVGTMY